MLATAGLDSVYHVEQPVFAIIDRYPDPLSESAAIYRSMWVTMGFMATAVATIGIWWVRKSVQRSFA